MRKPTFNMELWENINKISRAQTVTVLPLIIQRLTAKLTVGLTVIAYNYSGTCLRRPLMGPSKCGLCHQVVSLSRVIRLEIASLGLGFSCLLGQVVALSEWSP